MKYLLLILLFYFGYNVAKSIVRKILFRDRAVQGNGLNKKSNPKPWSGEDVEEAEFEEIDKNK